MSTGRKDRTGRTPLHEAGTNGDTKTLRVLLRYDADVGVRDDRGQTPLDRASANRQHSVAKVLEKYAQQKAEGDAVTRAP